MYGKLCGRTDDPNKLLLLYGRPSQPFFNVSGIVLNHFMEKKSRKRNYDKDRKRITKKKKKIVDSGDYGEDADNTLIDMLTVNDVQEKLVEYEVGLK